MAQEPVRSYPLKHHLFIIRWGSAIGSLSPGLETQTEDRSARLCPASYQRQAHRRDSNALRPLESPREGYWGFTKASPTVPLEW